MSKQSVVLENTFTEVSNVNGIITLKYADEEAYNTAGDIDAATLKKVAQYNKSYIAAAATAGAAEAQRLMEGNKDVTKVIIDYPFSPSKDGFVNVSIDRSKTFRVPNPSGEAGEVTKSAISVAVKDPFMKAKSIVKGLESELTKALIG